MMIGNPLMLSPGFPPPHTVRAAFTAHGVPSNSVAQGFKRNLHTSLQRKNQRIVIGGISAITRSLFSLASFELSKLRGLRYLLMVSSFLAWIIT